MTSPRPPATLRARLTRGRAALLAAVSTLALAIALAAIAPSLFAALTLDGRRRVLVAVTRTALCSTALALGAIPALCAASLAALARRRRTLATRLGLAALMVVLALGGAELAARAWTAALDRRPPISASVSPSKSANELVVVGSSTALGYPFSPQVSIGQIVAREWNASHQNSPLSCTILADLGLTAEGAALRLARRPTPPSILIIICGSSEFSARFKPERRVDFDEAPRGPALRALYDASLHSALFRGLYRWLRPHWETERWGDPLLPQPIDLPWFTPSEQADVLDRFEADLRWLLDYGRAHRCRTVLVLPPSNESGFEPNRSILAWYRGAAQRADLLRRLESARLENAVGVQSSIDHWRGIAADFPEFAEGHFRLARLLEQVGDQDGAGRHYRAACDLDAMPTRFHAGMRAICQRVARAFPAVTLVDGRAALALASPQGFVGDGLMLDGPHPSLRGTIVLAQSVLRALDVPDRAITASAIIDDFELDQATWIRAARWGHDFYKMWAPVRFDPRERRRKSARFREVAGALAAGAPIGAVDFPPLAITEPAARYRPVKFDRSLSLSSIIG